MQKLLVVLTVLSLHGFPGLLAMICCGKPLVADKIVGGADSTIGQWPWQVYLKLYDGSQCGGSLISESWVLTAAHCFETPVVDVSQFTVYLGVQKLSDLQDRKIVVRKVKQVIVYPTYAEQGSSGDIALVKLESPVTYTPTILPVCLPANTVNLPEGMLCWATGWGYVRDNVPLTGPKTLQAVQLPLISNNNCESLYRESLGYSSRIKLIQDDMICAGFKYGQKDACQGDSGGPLVCNIKGVWVQMGIISWGVGCAEPYHPGVYTRVQNYVSWIDLYMASSENSNKLKAFQFTQHVEKVNPQFRFNPENSSQSYILYEINYTESGNLTDDSSEPKTGLLVGNGAHARLWSMANAMLVLLGLLLLL
ncbi:serine protease 27-like [Ranitomeya variabilis]|uniref:serine protease 27-like n=1 Tax=Ranitomeya variabilis TaxID=490064 RepID=UPI004056C96B